jgi:hypothetical protein
MRRAEARLRQAIAVVIVAELGRLAERLSEEQVAARMRKLRRMLRQQSGCRDESNSFRLWICTIACVALGAKATEANVDRWVERRVVAIRKEARQANIDRKLLKQIRPGRPLPAGVKCVRTDGSYVQIVTASGRPLWSCFS